jgi:PAS domain S-box-containing protein
MNENADMTKEQLLAELSRLREENSQLRASADELRRVEDELRVLHEAAFEGIMIHEKGVLLKANEQYYRMFGYEPHELVGKQVIPLTIVPETLDFRKRRVTGDGVTTYEIQGKKKDGTTFLMEVRGKLMQYQGRKVRGVAVMDISEQKKVEEALRESEKRLRFLSSRLFEAQEHERRRLSKELHDQLGHDLVLLKSSLRSIEKKLAENQEALKNECENTLTTVNEIIENVRRISRDLMPSILEDLGLVASIRWLVENFSKQHSIRVTLDVEYVDHLFSPGIQVNLYRIFQETLTNISKHAAATRVSLEVKEEKGCVAFRVQDNGKGFEVNKVMDRKLNNKGVGLTAMNERIRMVGGSFEIQSRPGEGTKIEFKVPIGEKED